MKVLYQINYVDGVGADRWISSGWRDAFEDVGHRFFLWPMSEEKLEDALERVEPDLIMVGQKHMGRANVPTFENFRAKGGKIAVQVDSFFHRDEEALEVIKDVDPADLYYGEIEPPYMDHFTQMTGRKYHLIANAAHHRLHKPTEPVEGYKCDIVFLGAMMPNKREALEMLLLPLKKKYNVKIYGPNWTPGDNLLRGTAKAARFVGMARANAWISKMRLSIPAEDESKLYSSAKICVNIHERGEHIKSHVILNERTFKIPACGGFEICDFVPPLRNYFAEDEMVMADDKNGDWVNDWFKKIDYYLKHDEERRAIQERGTARAINDHTYIKRVEQLLKYIHQKS